MEILNHPAFVLVIVLCILGEWVLSRYYKKIQFSPYEALSNFAIIGIDKGMGFLTGDGKALGQSLWQLRLLDWDFGPSWNFVLTFVMAEFLYYCTHWYNHNVNLGWCTHIVHHSPTKMNLTVGYRLGVTRFISLGWLIFMPSVLLGFNPELMAAIVGVILLYQFFIHTELIPPLGPLEWVLNTPSNHRVHHSDNPEHYNKNLGGLTMFFDHLFKTYQKEPATRVAAYGIHNVMAPKNLFHEIFVQWKFLFQCVKKTPGFLNKVSLLFRSPETLEKMRL